jgi:hypothetical protein
MSERPTDARLRRPSEAGSRLMLVDAANLYFRAFYALPDSITA